MVNNLLEIEKCEINISSCINSDMLADFMQSNKNILLNKEFVFLVAY